MKNNRNGMIDLMKFIFAIILVIFHGSSIFTSKNLNFPFFYRGAIAVEFFFIVSGFLMAKSINKNNSNNDDVSHAYTFFKKKISQFYPALVICWLFSFIIVNIYNFSGVKNLVINCFESIWELFLLRNAGFSGFRVIPQTWYISAMILAMLVIYPIYNKHKKYFEGYIAPLISIIILGYIFYTTKSLVNPNYHYNFFYKSTLRGLSEICLGIYCYFLCEKLKRVNFTKFGGVFLSLIEIFGYIFGIYYMQYYQKFNSTFDFIVLLFFAVSIIISFSNKSSLSNLLKGNFWSKLGKFSLYPYLVFHALVIVVPKMFSNLNPTYMFIAYLSLTIIVSLILFNIEKYFFKMLKKLKKLIIY